MSPSKSPLSGIIFFRAQRSLIIVLGVLSLASLLTVNPWLSLACLAVFGWIWFGSFRSPFRIVIAAYLTFQWLQVSMIVWLADFQRADLAVPQFVQLGTSSAFLRVEEKTTLAVLFGLCAVACISLGFRLVPGASRPFQALGATYRPPALFVTYLLLLMVDLIGGPLVGGGFAQALIVIGKLKYLPAALLLYNWVLHRQGGRLLAVVILVEVVVGFSGFFSEFKQIFFVLGVALLTLAPSRSRQVLPLIAASLVLTLFLGGVWTAVKPDYRSALNQGTQSQVATLSVGERWEVLETLIAGKGLSNLGDSAFQMASRISYVEYLALVLDRIPKLEPPTGGELWGAALENIFVPRFLYPDKPALKSDSEVTMRYTGVPLASDRQGTSISIGYAGDSYIDFGLGAFLIFIGMGLMYGAATSIIVKQFRTQDTFAAIGTVIVLLAGVAQFEMSSVKLLAGFLWSFIITAVFATFIWAHLRPLLVTRPPYRISASKVLRRVR